MVHKSDLAAQAQDAGTLLVAAEAARKKGSAASFRSASERTGGPGNKLLYYTAEYTKSVLTVSRVVGQPTTTTCASRAFCLFDPRGLERRAVSNG